MKQLDIYQVINCFKLINAKIIYNTDCNCVVFAVCVNSLFSTCNRAKSN